MPQTENRSLSDSLEDYLEAILRIVQHKQAARAKDIGSRLRVGRSSVTGALRALASRDLINYAPYDIITLTDKGRSIAEDVVRRHEALRDFFVSVLLVGADEAESTACKLEHAISEDMLERLLAFIEYVRRCPHGGVTRNGTSGMYTCEHDTASANCMCCIHGGAQASEEKTAAAGPRMIGYENSRPTTLSPTRTTQPKTQRLKVTP